MNKYISNILLIIGLFVFTQTHAIDIQKDQESHQSNAIQSQAKGDVFANWLFTGAFARTAFSGINPAYRISQGDSLLVQLWGGIDYQNETKVDAQGNIFIPKVGPVKVQGVNNADLNKVVLKSIKRVYKSNVEAYVTLMSSQTVKVFLSGMVNNPGLYEGQSADSILAFIDKAGGIREQMGSYRDIEVKRNGKTQTKIDLYQFIEQGRLPNIQLQDGDVIFVSPKVGDITITGEVGFEGRYEVIGNQTSLKSVLSAVAIKDSATHITIVEPHNSEGMKEVKAKQYRIGDTAGVTLRAGSSVKVSSQLRAKSISVEVIGEHDSEFEMVVPWGATLADLLGKVEYSALSNKNAIQLYRESVAKRQKDMLMASLQSLEQSVLTARSETTEAAKLRAAEAETILKWIDKAKQVEPRGQVLLADGYNPNEVILQQGDKVVIPSKTSLVMIHGEVLFPTAITYNADLDVEEYIGKAGGTTADIDDANILIMKPNGSFVDVNSDLSDEDVIAPGDEIFVLAKPDVKSLQLTKDITQILYQVAVSAAVVVAL
ncbi:polysaccharide export protein [Bermanella marisrubri]|uniref:KpsD protein n=1 Tax=Bermanella marisrubri TaxID=207949 RepID=Q1N092_9GAMM|nr:polysaccharide biosynthesis/export family protein [Bermanella marisrubri]EAT11625.1 KpsD protein [Oceanobacter sp. RED65] [Bermanella marisrubri]QIZ83332.1 polysaccharide export protein [Bermanella marisrubri]